MLKLLTKKSIFYFLTSLITTLVVGFLFWAVFIGPDSSILEKVSAGVNKINSLFFTASLSQNNVGEDKLADQSKSTEKILPQTDNTDNQNIIVLANEDTQNQLDDIQEKLDIIKQKVLTLVDEQNQNNQVEDKDEKEIIDYPKIFISEIETAGCLEDKEEFVELYNPNDTEIDLTNWSLQRKTAGSSNWSTYVSASLFVDKKIPANGYFLISRTGYYHGSADIFTDNPITDNNSFVLKNPNGEISDKVGFGSAFDPELVATINPLNCQSVGRKVLSDGKEQNTNDNYSDFELQNLTPKSKNSPYLGPLPQIGGGSGSNGISIYKNILISEVQISPIDKRFIELYNPNQTDVNLTGWYLQRKTSDSYNSFVSSTHFEGKIIPANGYFLISRLDSTADILLDLTLTSNNFLALKSPDEEIVDEISFGDVEENKSFGRKVLSDGTEQNSDDDSADFELDIPTPKAKNITYTELPAPALKSIAITTPATKLIYTTGDSLDITGLVITGTYSDDSTKTETITLDNITGFDSANAVNGQTLTITFNGQTVIYTVDIKDKILQKNILINEIQVNPIERRFIELYNPNNYDIDLTGWYIQRKTKTASSFGSFISSANFAGKIIPANGYFLISRQIEGSDILLNITLSSDNSLVLKNSGRDIIDKVGWGEASDSEGAPATTIIDTKSITRTDGMDTDNNNNDFVILDTPTPKGP